MESHLIIRGNVTLPSCFIAHHQHQLQLQSSLAIKTPDQVCKGSSQSTSQVRRDSYYSNDHTHASAHIHTHTHTHTQSTHKHTHTHTQSTRKHTHTSVHTCKHTHASTHQHTQVHTQIRYLFTLKLYIS